MTDSTKPHCSAYIPRCEMPAGIEGDWTAESFYGGKNHPGNFVRLSMRHKVSDLEGALLDAAVAKAQDDESARHAYAVPYEYSTDWHFGGPIIERERIDIGGVLAHWELNLPDGVHVAKIVSEQIGASKHVHIATGSTPLIAAMRAFCAAKLGDEVELP